MLIWVVEMDYEAYDTRSGGEKHPWRYYVLAETASDAEQKVYADRSARMDGEVVPQGNIARVFKCPSGIVTATSRGLPQPYYRNVTPVKKELI